ncbi:hypothetical protein DSLASN_23530 [Desulfoluna limicola]|uniref:Transcription factor zinc-finger domain-containing protein n=1 Tax=Desulfoluna limicola TaxID=2810562 RepID=A0ABM7PGP0_9BACT|nr:zf-TFIIB domain-containing protein [Desulfoluna limicola]BCS96721.1 hypothetical protein DSLASN_23530 [Desulfoluna limicola]
MKCPKCKTTDLKKPDYNSPWFCEACGGMWLINNDNSCFPNTVTATMNEHLSEDSHDKKTGICPSGHGLMIRAKVDIDEPFYLERCTACGGIWFDKGEWQRIGENNLAQNLNDIWSLSWQRAQGKAKNRESFLKTNQALLGEHIFQSIMALTEKLKDHPEKERAIALLQQEIL